VADGFRIPLLDFINDVYRCEMLVMILSNTRSSRNWLNYNSYFHYLHNFQQHSRINVWHVTWHILLSKAHREEQKLFRQIPECYETESSLPCTKQFATDLIISQTNAVHQLQHSFKLNLILSSYQCLGLLKESEKTVAGNVW